MPETAYGIAFAHDNTFIFFKFSTRQWCLLDQDKLQEEPHCLEPKSAGFSLTKKETKTEIAGRFELGKNPETIFLFSSDVKGKKDMNKPYFEITSTTSNQNAYKVKSGLKISIRDPRGANQGVFNIEAPFFGKLDPVSAKITPDTQLRGNIQEVKEDVVDFSQMEVQTTSGCGSKISSSPITAGMNSNSGGSQSGQ